MSDKISKTIGIIGYGNMGQIIASRLLDATDKDILVFDKDPNKAKALGKNLIRCKDTAGLLERSDIIIIAVKPQDARELLAEISSFLRENKLIVSIMAGKTTAWIALALNGDVPIVRVMPNIASAVGKGVACVCANELVKKEQLQSVELMFGQLGEVVQLPEELFSAVTAVSGSGPAYFLLLLEALIEVAGELGIEGKSAKILSIHTGLGALELILKTTEEPAVLIERIASKGGTTEAALNVFKDRKFKDIVKEAVKKAHIRSKELSKD